MKKKLVKTDQRVLDLCERITKNPDPIEHGLLTYLVMSTHRGVISIPDWTAKQLAKQAVLRFDTLRVPENGRILTKICVCHPKDEIELERKGTSVDLVATNMVSDLKTKEHSWLVWLLKQYSKDTGDDLVVCLEEAAQVTQAYTLSPILEYDPALSGQRVRFETIAIHRT